jgi:hypothetical protein
VLALHLGEPIVDVLAPFPSWSAAHARHPRIDLMHRDETRGRDVTCDRLMRTPMSHPPIAPRPCGIEHEAGDVEIYIEPSPQPGELAMKLTIFAATGGIGRQILEQAVVAGRHD